MTQETEAQIQKRLAQYLDGLNLFWTATANGGKRDKKTACSLKAQGVKRGVPTQWLELKETFYLSDYQRAFAFSAILSLPTHRLASRLAVSIRGSGQSYKIHLKDLSRVGAVCAPEGYRPRRGKIASPVLPSYLLVRAYQHL